MPFGSLAHIQFWRFSADLPPPVPSRPGYPGWQAAVICGSLLGALQGWWERIVWTYRTVRFVRTWSPRLQGFIEAHGELLASASGEERLVLLQVLQTMRSPDFPAARAAVRTTATTLGFNNPKAWVKLSHTLKERHDWAENSWRHLNAMQLLDTTRTTTLTNPQKNLMVELAYQGFAVNPRGSVKD